MYYQDNLLNFNLIIEINNNKADNKMADNKVANDKDSSFLDQL